MCTGQFKVTVTIFYCRVVSAIMQTGIHTAEPFMRKPSPSEVEVSIGKLEVCKKVDMCGSHSSRTDSSTGGNIAF
jgi:hypothetical protein